MKMNKHYNELKASYLFVDIAHKVAAYQEAHPEKEIIRLGIGDVTQPLAKCVVDAMHDAVTEMGTKEGFHGYGPEQGYPFLKQAIQGYYAGRGTKLDEDEIFISDGAKSDLANVLGLFDVDNTVLVPDPVYPTYVDDNVTDGRKIIYGRTSQARRVAELSGVFRIVVNASTVSSDEIASWCEAGADVTRFAACHNFYPKPYTGLALEDIARVNLRLAALGFEIMAFVPGDANVRGPVFEGLPTVEAQRGRASKVALNMLELAHGADCDIVLAGDPDLSDAGWTQFAHVSAGYVDLQCELEPGYAYVRGQIHHDRPDSSTLIFRSQESRTTLKPDSVPMDAGAGLSRKTGSIAVSNSGYGRYEGELEIARVDLPGDERMNVAGHITPEAMELLPFIKRGFGVRFV